MSIEEALEKAGQAAPQAQENQPVAPEATQAVSSDQAASQTEQPEQAQSTPSKEPSENKPKWDGDVNKLPSDLQEWAKEVQRNVSKKLIGVSDAVKKAEDYDRLTTSEEWKSFVSQKNKPAESQVKLPTEPLPISSQDWEEAQLDSSGAKFYNLVSREVQRQINTAAQMYGAQLQNLQQANQTIQWKQAISDFTDVHPEMVEFHEMGLLQPLMEAEMYSGKHKTYDSLINAAYEKAAQAKQRIYDDALKAHQGRVVEKKNAVTSTGNQTTGEFDTFVADKNDALSKAIDFALEGRKVKVRSKK